MLRISFPGKKESRLGLCKAKTCPVEARSLPEREVGVGIADDELIDGLDQVRWWGAIETMPSAVLAGNGAAPRRPWSGTLHRIAAIGLDLILVCHCLEVLVC